MPCKHLPNDLLPESTSLRSIRHKLSNIIMGLYGDQIDTSDIAISELSRIITIIDFTQYQPDNKLQNVRALQNLIKEPLQLDDRYLEMFINIFPSTFKLDNKCLVIKPTNFNYKTSDLYSESTSLDVLALKSFLNKSESFANYEEVFTIHKPLEGD